MHLLHQWWRPYLQQLRYGTAYLGAVMIVVIWTAAALHLMTFKSQLLESVTQHSANLARAFERDVITSLRGVDWTVQLLRQHYLREPNALDFAALARELTNGVSIQYVIIGPNGFTTLSSVATNTTPINLSDREHFRVHLESNRDTLFVSKPVLGRTSGKWTIQLTRRLTAADGAFAGVIVASVEPTYFSRLYNNIDVGRTGAIALFGEDGVVRSRKGVTEDGAGQPIMDSQFFEVIRSAPEGPYNEFSPIDGTRQLGSFRHVQDFPLIVSVGFGEDEVLTSYRSELAKTLGATATLTLLLLAGISFSARFRAAHQSTTDALREAEQLALTRTLELKAGEEREANLRRDVAMRQEIAAFNNELVGSVKAFTTMIERLTAASTALNTAALRAREGSSSVADAANRAAQRVADVASAANQLAATADDVADKTRQSAVIFRDAQRGTDATNIAIDRLRRSSAQFTRSRARRAYSHSTPQSKPPVPVKPVVGFPWWLPRSRHWQPRPRVLLRSFARRSMPFRLPARHRPRCYKISGSRFWRSRRSAAASMGPSSIIAPRPEALPTRSGRPLRRPKQSRQMPRPWRWRPTQQARALKTCLRSRVR